MGCRSGAGGRVFTCLVGDGRRPERELLITGDFLSRRFHLIRGLRDDKGVKGYEKDFDH